MWLIGDREKKNLTVKKGNREGISDTHMKEEKKCIYSAAYYDDDCPP